jgi:hypothetical protein
MNEFHDQRFFGGSVRSFFGDVFARSVEICDIALANCEFDGCVLPSQTSGKPHIIRNIHATDASQMNCSISTAAIEDVIVHNLKRTGDAPLFLWGCVFHHVVLSGSISAVKINRSIGGRPETAASAQLAWDAFVRSWYDSVDWAIDISKAKFGGGFTLEAVPGDKVRRDPATQVLIRRSALADPDWRKLEYDGTAIDIAISWFEKGSQFDTVVIAARTARKWAKRDVAVLDMLRKRGIADPN